MLLSLLVICPHFASNWVAKLERISAWVSLILTLEINVVKKGSVSILEGNLAFRKISELEAGYFL